MPSATGIDRIAEFRLHPSRSGCPTVLHSDSGIWLHSRVDPVREARIIAAEFDMADPDEAVLLGGGLGYLPEALMECRSRRTLVTVIEPHPSLLHLARISRPHSAYVTGSTIRVITAPTASSLQSRIRAINSRATVVWSPYLPRLTRLASDPLSQLTNLMYAERVASPEYSTLIAAHEQVYAAHRDKLQPLPDDGWSPTDNAVVAGAGPSLDRVVVALQNSRTNFVLVAASGAVPSLVSRELLPDWVVALEAKDCVASDLALLPAGSRVVVLPSCHPSVLRRDDLILFSGCNADFTLLTRGGTSMVPVLDFALRGGAQRVYLIGLDLSCKRGEYATDSRRQLHFVSGGLLHPRKFEVMRFGLERTIRMRRCGQQEIFHVIDCGSPLIGTTKLPTDRLGDLLSTGGTERLEGVQSRERHSFSLLR